MGTDLRKMHPLFSVIIPCFNRADLMVKAIESALNQEISDYDMIVVDDGSMDETQQILNQYGNRLRTLRQDNQGVGGARNTGINQASGSYIAFLDSDDVWFPWTLSVYAEIIQDHDNPAIVTGCPFVFRRESELAGVTKDKLSIEAFPDYFASSDQWRWFSASSFVMRRDLLVDLGGFRNIQAGEDADLILRMGTAKGFVHLLSPYTFGYREHRVSLKANCSHVQNGVRHIIEAEHKGGYPGGKMRKLERQRIITRAVRPVVFSAAQNGDSATSIALYAKTFWWNIRLARLRYLIAIPFIVLWTFVRDLLVRL